MQLVDVRYGHVDEEVVAARDDERGEDLGQGMTYASKPSTTSLLSGLTRIDSSAWTGRLSARGPTAAWNPVITPRLRSARVRSGQVDGATPSEQASSLGTGAR
ncbi:hypothetical protein SUDANB58_05450 [Streptomyces sp. enrichment culture]|uniref:hypothetical protein n=1 Tax=Streptomyces sp. enrichment culture TaxID=1795815 RepID=UPI003F572D4A